MSTGALLAISGGLIVALPTSLTGLLDYFDIPKRTPARKLAVYHLLVMLTATATFAATWLAQRPGYDDGEVTSLGLILGVAALGLLTIGGTLGGALAYVYGVRVVKRDVPLADALIPGRLEETPAAGRPQAVAAQSGGGKPAKAAKPAKAPKGSAKQRRASADAATEALLAEYGSGRQK